MRNFEFEEDAKFTMQIHGQEYEITMDDEFMEEVSRIDSLIESANLEEQRKLTLDFFNYLFGEDEVEEIFGGNPTYNRLAQLSTYMMECIAQATGGMRKPETRIPYAPKKSGRAKKK